MIQPRPPTIGTHSGCSSGRAMTGAAIEIAKVVVDVATTVSALMNVLEEPLQTPSRYQRIMLEDDETAQSPVVSSGPARSPSRANVCR